MTCYRPVIGYQTEEESVTLNWREGNRDQEVFLPCGKCVGCAAAKKQEWAIRCTHEATTHSSGNAFLTLTYADDQLPPGGWLRYRDFQLFMKRLRKKVGKARFFMCGEYGERTGRAHYHALIFGQNFRRGRQRAGGTERHPLYRVPWLEETWGHGAVVVGTVTPMSAAYCAGYVLKKADDQSEKLEENLDRLGLPRRMVDRETGEELERPREFIRMSRHPGIGARFHDRYKSDLHGEDRAVLFDGTVSKVPRFYDRKLKAEDPEWHDQVKAGRASRRVGKERTTERLRTREVVHRARLSLRARPSSL